MPGGWGMEEKQADGMAAWFSRPKKKGRRLRRRGTNHEELMLIAKDELRPLRTMRQTVELAESAGRRHVRLHDEVEEQSEEVEGAGEEEEMRVWEQLWQRFSLEAGGMAFPCGKYAGMPLRDVPYPHLQCLRFVVESELASAVDGSLCSKSELRRERRERRAQRALVKQNSALVEQIRVGIPSYCLSLCRGWCHWRRFRRFWEGDRLRLEVLRALNCYFRAFD